MLSPLKALTLAAMACTVRCGLFELPELGGLTSKLDVKNKLNTLQAVQKPMQQVTGTGTGAVNAVQQNSAVQQNIENAVEETPDQTITKAAAPVNLVADLSGENFKVIQAIKGKKSKKSEKSKKPKKVIKTTTTTTTEAPEEEEEEKKEEKEAEEAEE